MLNKIKQLISKKDKIVLTAQEIEEIKKNKNWLKDNKINQLMNKHVLKVVGLTFSLFFMIMVFLALFFINKSNEDKYYSFKDKVENAQKLHQQKNINKEDNENQLLEIKRQIRLNAQKSLKNISNLENFKGIKFDFANMSIKPVGTPIIQKEKGIIIHKIKYSYKENSNEDLVITYSILLLDGVIDGVKKIDKQNNIIYFVEKI